MVGTPRSEEDKATSSTSHAAVGATLGSGACPCKLFVGGLSTQTTTEALRDHFGKYGHVMDAVVMSKHSRPRGFGFVTFDRPLPAAQALAEPQRLDGRLVDVKRAVPGEKVQDRTSNKIFVGGLKQDVTTEELRCYFSKYGFVTDAVVMVDRRTSRSRGFGFVRFHQGPSGFAAAEAALADFSSHCLRGKWVEVKAAAPAALLQEAAVANHMAFRGGALASCSGDIGEVAGKGKWLDAFRAYSDASFSGACDADLSSYYDWASGCYPSEYEVMAIRQYLGAILGAGGLDDFGSVPRTRGRRGGRRRKTSHSAASAPCDAEWFGLEAAACGCSAEELLHAAAAGCADLAPERPSAEADRSTQSGHSDGADDDDDAMDSLIVGCGDLPLVHASVEADLPRPGSLPSSDAFTREDFLSLEVRPCTLTLGDCRELGVQLPACGLVVV